MRQQLVFLFMCCILCKNGLECEVVSKTNDTAEDFSTEDDLGSTTTETPTEKSVKHGDSSDINTNGVSFTLASTTNLTNDIEESSIPFLLPKLSKFRDKNILITETTTDSIYVQNETSTDSMDSIYITDTRLIISSAENSVSSTTSENSPTTTDISTFSTSTTQYPQGNCSAPILRYADLQVLWDTGPNDYNCIKTSIRFNCSRLNNTEDRAYLIATYNLADTNYTDIDKGSLSLQKGYQYNCMAVFIDNRNVEVTDPTSIILPPGYLKINATSNNLTVTWISPFVNQTLVYDISIKLLRSNHYMPSECENGNGTIFNYTTNNSYFFITDYLPDYIYTIKVSTTFWDFYTYSDCFLTTPTAAPGVPTNISVEEHVNTKNEKEYTLQWKMPCNSNGKIQRYHVKLTKANQSTVVEEDDVPYLYNETEYKLSFTNLTKKSYFNFELYAIGPSNEHGESFFSTFQTTDDSIPAPVVSLIDYGSTYFIIQWSVEKPNVNRDFIIHIYNLGPRYQVKKNCTIYPDYRVALNDTTSYNYTLAMPFYSYNASVKAINATVAGYVIIETNSSVPDAPDNLRLIVNENTLIGELSWEVPCNVNGIISNFKVVVLETYSEDNTGTNTVTELNNSSMNLQLQPSHIYLINVTVLLEDGLEGNAALKNYESPIGFPGLPILNISNVSNTSFVIEWLPPIEKTGPIQFYELNITSIGPRYIVPMDCSPQDDNVFTIIEGESTTNYTHLVALPYNRYRVQMRAKTSKGYGHFSIAEIDTAEGVPEAVRHVKYTINNNLTEEYDATVSITFDLPCHTYGVINRYTLEYNGTRKSYPNDNGRVVIGPYNATFIYKLQPEYNYTYYIWSNNEFFENMTKGYFNSPAGVPTFNASITIPIDSISTANAKIALKKEYFDLKNGDVRYIALLLRETIQSHNKTFIKWNSTEWPSPDEGVQQLTDCFWNPFETSDQVTFGIGTGSYCNPICSCNKPLKDDTAYHLTIRVFTSEFYRDGKSIFFQTDKISQLAVILGVIFGILFFAIVAIMGFLVWKKRLYRKLSYIYSKKPSVKPLVSSNTAIIAKKFIQYFKHTQSKPELLKEQFTDLEEKSKEIQAQKTCLFSGLLENKRKNRYVNISPYDDTRVKLLIDEDDEIGSDYINASYVKGYSGGVEYIATQGPLPTTCRDFWKMVIQENVTIIVMVAQFIEKNKQKCYKYFPKNHENLIISDDMEIRCSTELHFGTYLVRNLQVRKDSLQVSVTHMQFLEWPDFNVPTGTEHMLQFIYQIRERLRIEGGIVIVHCSAGVGRTGTLIAADMLLQNVNAGKQIDVFNTVLELRKQRVMMVQTVEQYVYLHRLVADHIDRPPTPDLNEASDPLYENMDMLKNQSESESNSKKKEEESEF